MTSSTVTAPELTAEQVQRILVEPLEQASVFLAAGPRLVDVTAAGVVRIPKLVSMGTPRPPRRERADTEVDPDFGEVTLLDGTSLKSITRFSNELARSSVVALDAALRAERSSTCQQDHRRLHQPQRSRRHPSRHPRLHRRAGDHRRRTVTLDKLLDAIALAYTANVDTSRLPWMMPSRTFIALRKLEDNSNQYLLQRDVTADAPFRLLGIPVTNRIPTNGGAGTNEGSVVLADFSQIAVARDLAPSVKLLDQTYADFDQQAIRVVARYDATPLNPSAVLVLRGVTS
jgi:predicted phage gp36 major capsid-like protein